MPYAEITKQKEKLFILHFSDKEPTDEEFKTYLDDLLKLYQKEDKFILIIDGSDSRFLESRFRNIQGRWIAENEKLIKEKCLGQIYVINHPVTKFTLRVIFLIKIPPVPFRIVSNIQEALETVKTFNKILMQNTSKKNITKN
jgi:hypothetical protein